MSGFKKNAGTIHLQNCFLNKVSFKLIKREAAAMVW